jgi:ABC-type amino acid transport substrate-binding protein
LVGIEVDILSEFASSLNLDIQFKEYDFNAVWELPKKGEVDIAAAGLSNNNRDVAMWSDPYGIVRRSLLVLPHFKKSNKNYYGIRRLGVVKGSMAHIDALRNYENDIDIIPDIRTGVIMLQGGEIDAVGTGSITANHFIKHKHPIVRLDIDGTDEHLRFSVKESIKKELDIFLNNLNNN